MKIRRFFAADMREALNQVSKELGPDAAIMSTQKTNGGVEVVAATDYDLALEQHNNLVKNNQVNNSQVKTTNRAVSVNTSAVLDAPTANINNNKPARSKRKPDIEWAQEPNMVAIKEEVSMMRELLQNQLGELTWSDKSRSAPVQSAMLRKMVKMGFPAKLADSFSKTIQSTNDLNEAWSQLSNNLCEAIPKIETNILQKGGIVSLVGPTGVGKTTTIAKLAARFVIEHGADKIALVTTDSYRVAAHEQLRTYANIMGVSMRVAHDADSLAIILDELSEKQLILIDTAGISQRDKRLAEQMSCLLNSGKSIDSYLVLSTTAQTRVLKDAAKTFSLLPLSGTILTKLDEAVSLGECLGVVINENLKVAYITDGQSVPEDLHIADPVQLIDKAVSLEETDVADWVTAMALNQG